jgi:hypothetical protein
MVRQLVIGHDIAGILEDKRSGRCTWRIRSTQRFHPVEPVAWSVSNLGVGGYTYGGVRSAGISDVATTPPAGTPRPTPAHRITRSSEVSNRVRTGSGTIRPTSTWMGRRSHRPSITPSTNPFPGRPEASPPTGSRFWPGEDHPLASSGACRGGQVSLIDPASRVELVHRTPRL